MIEVSNLTYQYCGVQTPALEKVSFEIAKGEIFGLLGPSGAGKSTIQKILIGLLKNYQGSAKLFGKEIADWDCSLFEKMGVAFELPNHYHKLTALENLRYFASLYTHSPISPEEVLQLVGLEEAGQKRVSQFSKGMKTRLGLARAMQHDPELLFLDEPTTGLDPNNAKQVKKILQDLREKGKTIFLTTHHMDVAEQLCDRVAFLVQGEIQVLDTPRNLKLQYSRKEVCVEYLDRDTVCSRKFSMVDLGKNPEFLQTLQSPWIQTIHTQEASLEEIFALVTGISLS